MEKYTGLENILEEGDSGETRLILLIIMDARISLYVHVYALMMPTSGTDELFKDQMENWIDT